MKSDISVETLHEMLTRLTERVYRLEHSSGKNDTAHLQDGRRRVLAYQIVSKIDHLLYGDAATRIDANVRVVLERAVQDILKDYTL